MQTFGLVIIVVSYVLAAFLVNKVQKLYMKMIGADVMLYSRRNKLIAIFIVGAIITGLFVKLFSLA